MLSPSSYWKLYVKIFVCKQMKLATTSAAILHAKVCAHVTYYFVCKICLHLFCSCFDISVVCNVALKCAREKWINQQKRAWMRICVCMENGVQTCRHMTAFGLSTEHKQREREKMYNWIFVEIESTNVMLHIVRLCVALKHAVISSRNFNHILLVEMIHWHFQPSHSNLWPSQKAISKRPMLRPSIEWQHRKTENRVR